MDELLAIRTFVHVVDGGSLSEAARRTHLSTSSVSRQVKLLEDRLGVRLLNRTTRNHNLTEAGQIYLTSVREILRQLDEAKLSVSSYHKEVKGVLRVHSRTSVGSQLIGPNLPDFLKRYPDLVVDISLTDSQADLVAEGVDVAIWLGSLADSSMIARLLRPSHRVVVGSPGYFEKNGRPTSPADLSKHNCLLFKNQGIRSVWRFHRESELRAEVSVTGNLQSDSATILITCAANGLGLALLHRESVADYIKSGQVETIFTEYEINHHDTDTALYAVYPHSRGLSPKVRAFIDFMVELFRENKVKMETELPSELNRNA